jgi:hypothetical protein
VAAASYLACQIPTGPDRPLPLPPAAARLLFWAWAISHGSLWPPPIGDRFRASGRLRVGAVQSVLLWFMPEAGTDMPRRCPLPDSSRRCRLHRGDDLEKLLDWVDCLHCACWSPAAGLLIVWIMRARALRGRLGQHSAHVNWNRRGGGWW